MTKNKKGFTIIEVVLVLAIAGLIFLMVFIALPALQRSQRNTRRRQDMARIITAISDYQANNNNKLPWIPNASGSNWENYNDAKDKNATLITKYIIGSSDYTYTEGSGAYDADGKCSDQFCDPDGTSYYIAFYVNKGTFKSNNPTLTFNHKIAATVKSKCSRDENDPMEDASGVYEFAIVYTLEGGAVYCGDNQ